LATSVTLVNLLIAMMTNSYSKIQDRVTEEFRFARIMAIREYRSLPRNPPPFNVFSLLERSKGDEPPTPGTDMTPSQPADHSHNSDRTLPSTVRAAETPKVMFQAAIAKVTTASRVTEASSGGGSAQRLFSRRGSFVRPYEQVADDDAPKDKKDKHKRKTNLEREMFLNYLDEVRQKEKVTTSSETAILKKVDDVDRYVQNLTNGFESQFKRINDMQKDLSKVLDMLAEKDKKKEKSFGVSLFGRSETPRAAETPRATVGSSSRVE